MPNWFGRLTELELCILLMESSPSLVPTLLSVEHERCRPLPVFYSYTVSPPDAKTTEEQRRFHVRTLLQLQIVPDPACLILSLGTRSACGKSSFLNALVRRDPS